ncbi:alpha/beta fold hydrolase [Rhodoplanes roseus]|nr:alpha/beta fold hydrolase [Rhodoplanes roseus]
MPFADIGTGRLYYETHGDGEPLVLVTGLGGLAAFWAPHVDAFARRHRVIVYDHRGTGQSTPTPGPYTVDGMADDLVALMDVLGIASAHLCGHSTGGAIGQILGARHPARVRSLLLAATWGRRDPYFRRCFDARLPILTGLGAETYVRVTSLLLYPPDWISRNYGRMLEMEAAAVAGLTNPEILMARIAAICDFDPSAEVGSIRAPTRIVTARDDMTTPPFFAEELHAAIRGSTLTVVDWGGHMFPLTAPAVFGGLVHDWLAAQAPATAAPAQPRT